jgi:signal transduction histidine kinase
MNRLGPRLFLLVTVAIVGITVTYDLLRLQRQRQAVITQLEREAGLVARAVEGPLQFWIRTGQRQALERLLRDIREAKGAMCVGVYDSDGNLDIASSENGREAGSPDACPENLQAELASESVLSRWSPLGTFRILAPLVREGDSVATLKLVFPSTVITDPMRRQRDVLILERGLTLAAIGLIVWLVISLGVSRPIRGLMRGVEDIGRGNLDARIDVKSRTEIGNLARAFNRMAESLQEAQRRRQSEEDRRIALERQLRHADKLAVIGKLASELAHEVGTPLNVISGRARLLRREFAEGDPRTENLEIIRTQVDRISRVIRRFLDLGRSPRMQQERVDVHPLIREVAAFLAPELRKKQIRLILSVPPGLPPIIVDPDGLSQVLLNVLVNAVGAVPPGGRIELVAGSADGRSGEGLQAGPAAEAATPGIEIRVIDTGHGIATEILPRIFEPFFSTKPGEGTGLGLSICRDIVRDHGGRISIASRPGEGTTVIIWLPLAPAEAMHEIAADSAG